MNFEKINKAVTDGWVDKKKHPTEPYWIYNYSLKAQFEWYWPEEVKQCRGLILDETGNIVARPFEKFFSIEQLDHKFPAEKFDVFEKLDGSLRCQCGWFLLAVWFLCFGKIKRFP